MNDDNKKTSDTNELQVASDKIMVLEQRLEELTAFFGQVRNIFDNLPSNHLALVGVGFQHSTVVSQIEQALIQVPVD